VRGEPRDILIVKGIFVVGNPSGLNDIVNTQLGQPEGKGVSSVMLSAAIGDLLATNEVAMAFTLRVEDCTGLLRPTVMQTHVKCEYARILHERSGAAAVVAAEDEPNRGILQ
jgi:hypothetical protein